MSESILDACARLWERDPHLMHRPFGCDKKAGREAMSPTRVLVSVTGCSDCPLRYDNYCGHPKAPKDDDGSEVASAYLKEGTSLSSPQWCPLREGTLTIRRE